MAAVGGFVAYGSPPAQATPPAVTSFDMAVPSAQVHVGWNPCPVGQTSVTIYDFAYGTELAMTWDDGAIWAVDSSSGGGYRPILIEACEPAPTTIGFLEPVAPSATGVSVEFDFGRIGTMISPQGDTTTNLFSLTQAAPASYQRIGTQIEVSVPLSYSHVVGGGAHPHDRSGTFTAHFHLTMDPLPFLLRFGTATGAGECAASTCSGGGPPTTIPTTSIPPAPATLTLTASQAKAAPGTPVTLTATASQAVTGADRILIFDPGAPGPLVQCATTAVCTTSVSLPSTGARSFIAYIAPSSTSNPPPGAKTASNPTAVAWSVV